MVWTIFQRLIASLLVIFGSLVLVFTILYVLPGDPTDAMIDPALATPEAIAALRHQLGVDQPFHVQLLRYFGGIFRETSATRC